MWCEVGRCVESMAGRSVGGNLGWSGRTHRGSIHSREDLQLG